jgi:hypothetical protein
MKKLLLILAITGIVTAPGVASSQQLFNFNGQALIPTVIGDDATAYLPVDDSGTFEAPIPLDFANFEYTIVVTGMTLDVVSGAAQDYLPGTITLYEDDATPADYSNPATFMDGTAILSGSLYSFTRQLFTATLGSGQGDVDWTGGTRVGEIAPADQTGWSFLVSISRRETVVVPGYDENWDGKVEPLEPVVDTDESSVSEMKARHQ